MGQESASPRFLRNARVVAQRTLRGAVGLALVGLAVATPVRDPEPFSAERAWGHLLKQVAFGPRVPGTEGHIKCRDWLLEELSQSTDSARLAPFTHDWSQSEKPVKMWNVVGESNWKAAKTRIVLMAHWDTRPTADMEPNEEDRRRPIPGANDGASGVAVLLELARALKERPVPGLGVQYVLVDGEDLGPGLDEMFLGAKAYVRNLPTPRPDYGILLDMVGDRNLKIPVEPYSRNYAPKLIREFFAHAATIGEGKTFVNRIGPEIYDDHIPVNRAGIPMIDLIDFDYPAWHTLADDVDQCSAESLGKVGRVMESWLRERSDFRDAKGRG